MTRRGFTLIELLVLLWLGGCVLVGGAWGGAGGAWRVVPGMLVGFVAAIALPTVVLLPLDRLSRWWRPARPPCFAGRCGPDAYRWEVVSTGGVAHERWRCACGDAYVARDDRFLRLVRDDVELAYMRRVGRRWTLERPSRA